MNREERIFLSNQFRAYCGTLSPVQRTALEQTMLITFSVKSIRNVQLWTREGAQTRNFIPTNNSTAEFYMRVQFARAILNELPINFPVKITVLRGDAVEKGVRLRSYLTDPYMTGFDLSGGALFSIILDTDSNLVIYYLADSNNDDGFIDPSADDSIWDDLEFDD